jgi:hypothetical protein
MPVRNRRFRHIQAGARASECYAHREGDTLPCEAQQQRSAGAAHLTLDAQLRACAVDALRNTKEVVQKGYALFHVLRGFYPKGVLPRTSRLLFKGDC